MGRWGCSVVGPPTIFRIQYRGLEFRLHQVQVNCQQVAAWGSFKGLCRVEDVGFEVRHVNMQFTKLFKGFVVVLAM